MPKLSIIVPVYNVYPYLRRCLESLVQQTLEDIEIIVVNDGTKDNSEEIIQEFAHRDKRIVPLKKENGGLSDARNFGLAVAKGEYVAFVDSDDYVDTTIFEKMYAVAKNEKCDLVECDFYWEYPNGKRELDQSCIEDNYFVDIRVVAWNKLYRKKLLDQTKVLFPKNLQFEDICFCYQLLPFVKKIGYCKEALYYYVQRDDSIANTFNLRVRETYDILALVLDYYREKKLDKKYEKELEYVMTKFILGRNFYRICSLKSRKYRKLYLQEGYDFLMKNFPNWKKNYYLKKKKGLRNFYYRHLNKGTYFLSAIVFHYCGGIILRIFKG